MDVVRSQISEITVLVLNEDETLALVNLLGNTVGNGNLPLVGTLPTPQIHTLVKMFANLVGAK